MPSDEMSAFVEIMAGKVVAVSSGLIRQAQEPGVDAEVPDRQLDEWYVAMRVARSPPPTFR
jgi:hypothetical protein